MVAMVIMAYVTLMNSQKVSIADGQIKRLFQQSNSDEIEAIEKDVEETNLNDIDQELISIESELEASN